MFNLNKRQIMGLVNQSITIYNIIDWMDYDQLISPQTIKE